MIVWVEGADGSGKSTLVNRLCDDYGFTRVKIPEHVLEPTSKDAVKECMRWKEWWSRYDSSSIKKPLIVERGHISEMVYRMNDTRPTYLKNDMIQKHLCGSKIIYCKTSTAFEDAMKRGRCLAIYYLCGSKIIYCKTSTAFEDAMKRGEDRTTSKTYHAQLCSDYRAIIGMLCRFYNCDCYEYNWQDDDIARVIKFINN